MSTVTPLRIGVILASIRRGRRGEAYAKWIHEILAQRPDVQIELLDLREYPLPAYDHPEMPSESITAATSPIPRPRR